MMSIYTKLRNKIKRILPNIILEKYRKLRNKSKELLHRSNELLKRNLAKLSLLCLKKINNINDFERKVYSQHGEDGIIEIIFWQIGTTNKFFVEIGVGSVWSEGRFLDLTKYGLESNTRLLKKSGWQGIMIDANEYPLNFGVKKEFITAENINEIFLKYNVPNEFDLLSIDIDGNDYWVWKALDKYYPRVVIIEYNASYLPPQSVVIPYDPDFKWDKTSYFGASLCALIKLAREKGYTLVGCENTGVNAFFIRDDLVEGHFERKSVVELYKPFKKSGYPKSEKKLMSI